MFWTILAYVSGGLLILHFIRIKKLDTKNPNCSLWSILKMYWKAERWYILTSLVGLIVFTNLLNVGLGKVLAQYVLGVGDFIDAEQPWGIRAISFFIGLSMQGIITWASQRKKDSVERQLEQLKEMKEKIITQTLDKPTGSGTTTPGE